MKKLFWSELRSTLASPWVQGPKVSAMARLYIWLVGLSNLAITCMLIKRDRLGVGKRLFNINMFDNK